MNTWTVCAHACADDCPRSARTFRSGGLVDAVLNLGLPAPMDIQVSGTNLKTAYRTPDLAAKFRQAPGVSDVLVPQDMDYPALRLDIDRSALACLVFIKRSGR